MNTFFIENEDTTTETTKVVTSTWSDNTNELTSVFTSSAQFSTALTLAGTSSGAFFIDVHNDATTSSVQYSVAYGHKEGSGSVLFNASALGFSPSSVIYNQYRQLVFGDSTTNFSFNGYTPNDIHVININRSRYKHNLKPGSLNLTLSGSAVAALHLTDDSTSTTGSAVITNAGRQFNIVSGSNGVRIGSNLTANHPADSGSYGLYYPDSGFIILNPAAVDHHIPIAPGVTSNQAEHNHMKLVNSIASGSSFIVDSEETVSSKYYFARVKNTQFNYSTNPTFRDTNGNLVYSDMEQNPKVYITTVGLYDTPGNLLAVAKLSQPITKEFSKEALIRIKLDY